MTILSSVEDCWTIPVLDPHAAGGGGEGQFRWPFCTRISQDQMDVKAE